MAANVVNRSREETEDRPTDRQGAIADLKSALRAIELASEKILSAAERDGGPDRGFEYDADELASTLGDMREDLAGWLGRLEHL